MTVYSQKELNEAIRKKERKITICGDLAEKILNRHAGDFISNIGMLAIAVIGVHMYSKYAAYEIVSYEKGMLVIQRKL